MRPACYCLFETPLGACGIAWREPADFLSRPVVTAVQLPEATPGATESGIARKSGTNRPCLPPPEIVATIERIRRHLGGEVQDFRSVAVDLSDVTPFFRRVYEAAREIPPGQTRTYGEIAKRSASPMRLRRSAGPWPGTLPRSSFPAIASPLPAASPADFRRTVDALRNRSSWPSKVLPSISTFFPDAPRRGRTSKLFLFF